jgi:hypothetical protein
MNTNCLVTKLKGVINNENLNVLGEFKFKVAKTSGHVVSRYAGSSDPSDLSGIVYVNIEDGDLYNYQSQTSLGNRANWVFDSAMEYTANSDCYITIENKYSLFSYVDKSINAWSLDEFK